MMVPNPCRPTDRSLWERKNGMTDEHTENGGKEGESEGGRVEGGKGGLRKRQIRHGQFHSKAHTSRDRGEGCGVSAKAQKCHGLGS